MTKDIPSILYADDNRFDIDLFLLALDELKLEYQVDVVRDGQEALDFLFYEGAYTHRTRKNPTAIMLDIKMPKLNSIEVLKLICSEDELQNIPIIMVTSSEMEKDIKVCYDLGANAYIVKPIDFDEFIKMVEGLSRFCTYLNQNS